MLTWIWEEPTTPLESVMVRTAGPATVPSGMRRLIWFGDTKNIGDSRVTPLLSATDTDWTHGDGPEVRGPMIALVMAMTGRPQVLDDLSGEGVATLRSRS